MTQILEQSSFLDSVDQANIPPGAYWVTIGEGHRVYRPGERFLVVDEPWEDWLLAWRDGQMPPERVLGSLIHRQYVSDGNGERNEPILVRDLQE